MHVPELQFLLTDATHILTLEEADKLVDAIANELSLGEGGGRDEGGIAVDNLISRVNLGRYLG